MPTLSVTDSEELDLNRMKISTEEFINFVQERPALWQKSHPDFANRDIRNKLVAQLAGAAGIDAAECTKKLKNLKDSMRAQVAKLPKTSSGSPAFNLSDHITWPFFRRMMFMKGEFVGRKMTPSLNAEEGGADETPGVEEHFCQCFEPEELSAHQCASSSALTMTIPKTETSNGSWDSLEGSAKKLKRRLHTSSQFDYEERKLAMLEKVASPDELDTFASDIANDLRKIKCPLKLLQAKSKIRRIAEDFAMSEFLPPASPHDTTITSLP